MKILAMGASSKVGKALRSAWREHPTGHDVLWQYREGPESAPGTVLWSPLEQARPDLGPLDAVIVLSGVTPGGPGDLSNNTALALAGLRLAAQAGAKHVFLASSQAVYAASDTPMTEAQPIDPAHPYGQAKAEMEAAAQAWLATRGDGAPGLTCLRIGNVAGADMLGKAVRSGLPVGLDRFGDGKGPVRSYIGAGGFARVLQSLLTRVAEGKDLPAVLNIAAPQPTGMASLLHAWGKAFDWKPAPATARQAVTLDVGRLCALHDFTTTDSDPAQMVAEWERYGAQ